MEALVRAALREGAAPGIAAGLEGEDASHVGLEGEHLEVEHQLHVLLERIGHADRRFGQLALGAARVTGFDELDAPLELADVLEVLVEPLLVGRSELALEADRKSTR